MKLPRREFLHLAAGAAALPAVSRIAWAQTYPTRPVRIVVGFAAGGATDITRAPDGSMAFGAARPAIRHREPAGRRQPISPPKRSCARQPDGYTLLLSGSSNAINATLYDKLSFNFIRDIAPVAGINRVPYVMVVNPSVPAKTVPEFIAYAKANPGQDQHGIFGGNGSCPTCRRRTVQDDDRRQFGACALSRRGARADRPHWWAGAGDVRHAVSSSIEYIRAGKLRALAVTTATRSEALPDIPTVGDFVPGYEASSWIGIGAPKNTPAEIVDKLNQEINAGLADPKIKARLADLGSVPMPLRFARRLRQAHCRRNREVGQGDPSG